MFKNTLENIENNFTGASTDLSGISSNVDFSIPSKVHIPRNQSGESEELHAPKNFPKVEKMNELSEEAKKVYNRLGKYNPTKTFEEFNQLPLLGPYKDSDGTYTGQYKDGQRHGYGILVRLFDFDVIVFSNSSLLFS